MVDSYTDPVTGIVIPTPEERTGPQYAEDISNALLTLAHLTHTGVANQDGYQIPSAGIDFDDDLSAQNNNLITLRTTRFTSQGSPLNGVGDLNCFYVSGGEAWYNDSSGQQVQLTNNGVVNAASSNNLSVLQVSTNHTINSSDTYAVFNYSGWSGNRTFTLPLANTVPAGRFYYVKDKSGTANGSSNIITIVGSGADTLDGGASFVINVAYAGVLVMADGTSNWQVFPFSQSNTLFGPSISITATSTTVTTTAATDIILNASDDITMTATDDISITATDALLLDGYTVRLAGQLFLPTKAVVGPTTYTVHTTTKDVIIYCDPTSGAISINLPAATNGAVLIIQDVAGKANTNNITLVRSGGDTIQGLSANYVMDADFQGVTLAAYSGGSWFIIGT